MPLFLKDDYDHITEAGIMSSVCNLKELSDEQVREHLSCLTDREREVMQMLIGYDCASMSVNEVADHFELLPSRIRQIRNKALKKINSPRKIEFWTQCDYIVCVNRMFRSARSDARLCENFKTD